MLTLVLPIAGRGQRFIDKGYEIPKPFVDVVGQPMIQRCVDNLPQADKTVIIHLNDHQRWIDRWADSSYICEGLADVTPGAAWTVLAARHHIDPESELIIADCDQWVDWSPGHFLDYIRRQQADGAMPVFRGHRSHWSYAHFDAEGRVESVIEKVPVTADAISGVRYFVRAEMAFQALERLVAQPTLGEYHLGPVYNDLIQREFKILAYPVPRVYSMGTPVELEYTLNSGIFQEDTC
jgi:NDP-sugar pyrophosphorylase family protein